MKYCLHCDQYKELSAFGRLATANGGHNPTCKACRNAKSKAVRGTPEGHARSKTASRLNNAKRRATPEGRRKASEASCAWARRHPARICARSIKRYAMKLNATVSWDQEGIATIYEESNRLTKASGVQHNVDHILPLKGKAVSGLHVASNLRVVTASENSSKCNRIDLEGYLIMEGLR